VTKDIVENQYHDFDKFLYDVDMVVIMVGHSELRNNMNKLEGKVIFDTRKVCDLPSVYRL
jgi:UDP-N-acetyl-D-mannosaminuronic acid dehydrogenase